MDVLLFCVKQVARTFSFIVNTIAGNNWDKNIKAKRVR